MMSVWRTCAKNFCLFFSQNANMVTPSTIPTDSHRSIGWEVAALHDDMCCMESSKQVATFLHAGELPLPMLPLSTRDQLLLLAPCHLCSTFIVLPTEGWCRPHACTAITGEALGTVSLGLMRDVRVSSQSLSHFEGWPFCNQHNFTRQSTLAFLFIN